MISPFPSTLRVYRVVVVLGIALVATFAAVILVAGHKSDTSRVTTASGHDRDTPIAQPAKTRIAEHFGKLPLSFEINKGQVDQSVKFVSHGNGYDLFLTATEAVLRVQKINQVDSVKEPARAKTNPETLREGSILRLKMLGANSAPEVTGEDELPGKVNYFFGNDPEKWWRNIPTYRSALFKDVYPGVDVVYYGNQRELEYDLVVAAGGNPKLIRFSVEGVDRIRLDKSGRLQLSLTQGEVSLNRPSVYQLDQNGSRREVRSGYVVNGNEIRFRLERFDSRLPLVIDPVLSYSTLLGSGVNDSASGIAVDSQGSAYVVGTTYGTSFPTTSGAFKSTSTRSGAFVTKLDPTGTTLVYSTYISGEGSTTGLGISVDAAGNAHVTGSTTAPDFPLVNALKTTSSFFRTTDAAANWNNINSGLVGSVNALAVAPNAPNTIYATTSDGIYGSTDGGGTWVKRTGAGLSGPSFVNTMAVDPSNSSVVYVGHFFGLYKTTNGGDNWTPVNAQPLNFGSVFSITFDPSTSSTMYVGTGNGVFKSTGSGVTWIAQNNFGLPGIPNIHALAIDPTAPLTLYAGTLGNGLFKSTNGGAVWIAMNNGMGGASPTMVNAVVIDPANPTTVYTGHAQGGINKSTDGGTSWNPLTNGVPQGAVTAMIATSSAVYAAVAAGVIKTTNGGSNWTDANAGLWSSSVLTLVKHPTDPTILYVGAFGGGGSDAFVTKLNSAGSGVLFSTLLGGSKDETGNGIAVDPSGNISVAGETSSTNFPVVSALKPTVTFNGNCLTGFVTKFNPAVPSYVFSTYLGNGQCDAAYSVAADNSGNVYVTGRAGPGFPTANPFQPGLAGPQLGFDAFVSKFMTDGSVVYSTYLGGADSDTGFGIAADSSGNAYVTGSTNSSNFPTMNPIQDTIGPPLFGSQQDAFVTKLNSQGSALIYSTYLGGSGFEQGRAIAVDSANNVYVTGNSDSVDFPLVAGALRTKSPMFKSTDGAANWSNDNYGFYGASPAFGGAVVTDLAIHPTQPSTLYAGTGNGVFKSTNGGRTWSSINNGLINHNVVALVIDPATPSTLYAATAGSTIGNTGVYKTVDGGTSWNLHSNGISSQDLLSLVIDPVTPNTLYAGYGLGGPGTHLYKTTDGADNWNLVGTPPPFIQGTIAIDPLNHTTLYAADTVIGGGVYKSLDAGTTWQTLGLSGSNARFINVSPLTAGLVYAGTDHGLFKSVDGGANWSLIPSVSGKIVFDPISSSTAYLLSAEFQPNPSLIQKPQGVLKTIDNGQTWLPMNKGFESSLATALVIDPLRPSTVYVALKPPGGYDAFVTKINPAGNSLIYSTFIGGPLADNLSVAGAQASGIVVDGAGNAYLTGSTSSNAFQSTPNSYQPLNRGGNDAFISKLTMSYIISGQVLNNGATPLDGAEVVLNDSGSLTGVLTESDGSYQFFRLREGGTFTVTATKPHFTITPASQTFANLNSDHVLNFTAITSDSPFYTITGQITENGAPLAGVTVTLSGSQSGLRTTDSNGSYSFELIVGGNYTVTPAKLGFSFGPNNQTFNSLSANQTANFAANRQSFVVTNANNHGTGSLRDAIINANANLGPDTIVFNIPGLGVKTISLLNLLPEITERVTIDGTTQPGYAGSPLIEIDGLAVASGNGNANGLVIKAGSTTVRGLAIGNFRNGFGIFLNSCDNNLIQANYLGVAPDGTTARPNARGILLTNSSNNVIGGTTAATRNVISGNLNGGVDITGSGNIIQGNFIGTNAAGTAALLQPGGVSISNATSINNLIGGTVAGAGNLISGNSFGIQTSANATTIQGNLIGTDVTGTNKIPNVSAVGVFGLNTLVGGLTPGARNVISGNSGDGVFIRGVGNKVQGNYIGTDITGTLALGNNGNGVVAGDGALVGGTAPEARNIISGNGNFGNVALGYNNSGAAATVQGNYIGTDVTGTRGLGGSAPGVNIISAGNVVGGTAAGARNVISGNSVGIQIENFGNSGANVIQGNLIGLNAQGTGPLANKQQGIAISAASNNTIGGTQIQAGNIIAFNGGPGITNLVGTGNVIRGNSIFSNNGLGIDLGANGVTANDSNDSDSGPNNLQNFPVINGILSSANSTTIQGSLSSLPLTTFQVDFYSNAAVDPSGNGEGAQFFGSTSVNTDGNGNATINVTFPSGLATGRVITSTATDPNGNTSEFSAADSNNASGSVQFSVSSIVANEDLGSLTITVLRMGGASGNLTVDYATANGTAIAGQDYTATSGTLSFNGGETSKTFQIPILDDATTEPDETFSVSLSNSPTLEALGAPSTLVVTLQDHATPPILSISNPQVIEGNAGTTTTATFTLSLSALTSRTVSGNYATGNSIAFGGVSCNNQRVDYENASGMFSFQPATTTFTIPIKICGDNNAEAPETFRLVLSNVSGASLPISQGVCTIVNDDVLELVLEDAGPTANQAAALDDLLGVRDPFRIEGLPDWFVTGGDRNTRIALFARGLQLNPGELPSAVLVRFAGNSLIIDVAAEDVRPVPNTDLTQVVVKLPSFLLIAPGNFTVFIRAHTRSSNIGTIRIVQ